MITYDTTTDCRQCIWNRRLVLTQLVTHAVQLKKIAQTRVFPVSSSDAEEEMPVNLFISYLKIQSDSSAGPFDIPEEYMKDYFK